MNIFKDCTIQSIAKKPRGVGIAWVVNLSVLVVDTWLG